MRLIRAQGRGSVRARIGRCMGGGAGGVAGKKGAALEAEGACRLFFAHATATKSFSPPFAFPLSLSIKSALLPPTPSTHTHTRSKHLISSALSPSIKRLFIHTNADP